MSASWWWTTSTAFRHQWRADFQLILNEDTNSPKAFCCLSIPCWNLSKTDSWHALELDTWRRDTRVWRAYCIGIAMVWYPSLSMNLLLNGILLFSSLLYMVISCLNTGFFGLSSGQCWSNWQVKTHALCTVYYYCWWPLYPKKIQLCLGNEALGHSSITVKVSAVLGQQHEWISVRNTVSQRKCRVFSQEKAHWWPCLRVIW
jgi:hypothetical protein